MAAKPPVEGEGAHGCDALAGEELAEAIDLTRSERDVHEWELGEDILLLALRPAPAHGHHGVGALALDTPRLPEIAHEPRVRRPANGAGVEHDQVRSVPVINRRVAQRLEHPMHPL